MLYIPKISDYLKILTDNEAKNCVVINFSKHFKSTREKLNSILSEQRNLRKVGKLLYIFLTTPDAVEKCVELMQLNAPDNYVHRNNFEILNLFDPELQLISTKFMIKNK